MNNFTESGYLKIIKSINRNYWLQNNRFWLFSRTGSEIGCNGCIFGNLAKKIANRAKIM